MATDEHAVEVVIRTATAVLLDRLAPNEAVTILATRVATARSEARHLGQADPERAAAYAGLLRDVGRQLRERVEHGDTGPGTHHLRALLDDLAAVVRAFPA